MTEALMSGWIDTAGVRSAMKWSQAAAVASALLLGVPSPSRGADIGNFLGGVVGGMIGQSMQQPHYQLQPQYYQQQPQYYQQPQYQQPQTYQRRATASAAEARRQGGLKGANEP